MLFKEIFFLLIINWTLFFCVTSLRHVVVYEGRSNFSFACEETYKILANAYNYDTGDNSSKYIATADQIVPGEAYRYRIDKFQAGRKIIYTEPTSKYADNAYHDCIKEITGITTNFIERAVFVVLDDFQCDVNNKELYAKRDAEFQFIVSLNFTHITPLFSCETEGKGSVDVSNSKEYYENTSPKPLKGTATAKVVLKDFDENPLKTSCKFYYDDSENLEIEEHDHINDLPHPVGSLIATVYKQPQFSFDDDKDKINCKVTINTQYGPDNVRADLHPAKIDTMLCSYSGAYSKKKETKWKVDGNEVSGTTEDTLNISKIPRPAEITCQPCLEFYNKDIECRTSDVFELLDNSTLPIIKPPDGKNYPKNLVVFYDEKRPFEFYCHAFPYSPHIIDSSSYGPDGKLIADRDGIVSGENHRYKMLVDKDFTRTIVYNASSVSAYDDNIYHDCTVNKNETHRAALVVLSNFQCPETFVKGIEDRQFNLTYKIDYTHISPEISCNSNTLGTIRPSYKVISDDLSKPLKKTLTANLIFYFPKKSGTFANCTFIYNPRELIYLEEAVHLTQFSPNTSYIDPNQPTWAFEEDKNRPTCHTKLQIQYGPNDVEVKPNPSDKNILSCDYSHLSERYLYTNWFFNGISKFNLSLSSIDVRNEPSANISCEPCIQFFNSEISCKISEPYSWISSVVLSTIKTTTKHSEAPTSEKATTKVTLKPSTASTPKSSSKQTTNKPSATSTQVSTEAPKPTSGCNGLIFNKILCIILIFLPLF